MDKLINKIIEMKNPTVVGLDPKMEYIPKDIVEKNERQSVLNIRKITDSVGTKDMIDAVTVRNSILEFNKRIINKISDIVPAVKPQLAYYEMYGIGGMIAFYETVNYARSKGMYVIADGKRNDIGATVEAYAEAYLGENGNCDGLTVNGYLGVDGIQPYFKYSDKDIFVLVKTSNKSSGQLQDLKVEDGRFIYEVMGDLCEEWGQPSIGKHGYSNVGAVVGATYPEQLKTLRKRLPHTFFLIPGYGAQGGKAEDVALGFDGNGIGAVVNASRSIMLAYKNQNRDEMDFAECARIEAINMRDELRKHIWGE